MGHSEVYDRKEKSWDNLILSVKNSPWGKKEYTYGAGYTFVAGRPYPAVRGVQSDLK